MGGGWVVGYGWLVSEVFLLLQEKIQGKNFGKWRCVFFLKMKYLFFGSFGMECVFPQGREDVETL